MSDMLKRISVSMSNFLLFKIIFISLTERNEKLMGLIKEKQKDIIFLLKDQFFFLLLIGMMINKLRIWFLSRLVSAMHCFSTSISIKEVSVNEEMIQGSLSSLNLWLCSMKCYIRVFKQNDTAHCSHPN